MNARDLTHALGGRWHGSAGTAPCPVCQPERRRDQHGLSVADGADGRPILTCHKPGCDFRSILAAEGIAPGHFAAQRTFLVAPGRKAEVTPAKMMLGPVAGGAVRLSEGDGPRVIGEGIETCLALVDGLRAHRPAVRAALSAPGMAGLFLPARPGELVVAPDGDATGARAAEALAERASRAGWRVRLMPAPGGPRLERHSRCGDAAGGTA